MWNGIMNQAKAKFPHAKPDGGTTFPQNTWASREYKKEGGQYVKSKDDVDPRFRDYKKEAEDKKARKEKEKEKRRDQGQIVF
jgi:hypothetical protein